MSARLFLVLAFLAAIALPVAAQEPDAAARAATATTPAAAVQGFVDAVMDSNYAAAWSLLTRRSKNYIVSAVVQENKIDESDVRSAFDATDPRVVRGFWSSFHTAFAKRAGWLKGQTAHLVSGDDASAIVQYDGSPARWQCFYEDGTWHVGYAESFLIEASTK